MTTPTIDWNQPFPITSVCRADLREYLGMAEIAQLDDAAMRAIAEGLADAYCASDFWVDLPMIARHVLAERR